MESKVNYVEEEVETKFYELNKKIEAKESMIQNLRNTIDKLKLELNEGRQIEDEQEL